jgi:hypothetical protein
MNADELDACAIFFPSQKPLAILLMWGVPVRFAQMPLFQFRQFDSFCGHVFILQTPHCRLQMFISPPAMRPRIMDLHPLLLHESNNTNPMHPPNVDWEKNLVQNENVTSPNNLF